MIMIVFEHKSNICIRLDQVRYWIQEWLMPKLYAQEPYVMTSLRFENCMHESYATADDSFMFKLYAFLHAKVCFELMALKPMGMQCPWDCKKSKSSVVNVIIHSRSVSWDVLGKPLTISARTNKAG